MRKVFIVVAALAGLCSYGQTPPGAGKSFYVSAQTGNDSWSGFSPTPNSANTDGPFRTLARAQVEMQSSSVKTATVRAGQYSVSSFSLDWRDNGETWTSYLGETPVLDGGKTGTVTITGVNGLNFAGLTFQNFGPSGIVFNGATNVGIKSNLFLNCNQYCLFGSGVSNSIIDSNTINGQAPGNLPGTVGNAYQAIQLSYGSSNNQITHNLIENCQGGGIAFESGPNDPPNNDNLIDRNLLQNVDSNVFDMGAIYIYDETHSAVGNKITNNVINGNGGSQYQTDFTKAIYLDSAASNVLVSGNICHACGTFGWQIHAGDHNTIANNIFDLSSNASGLGIYQADPNYADYGMTANVFANNIVLFSLAPSSLYQVNTSQNDSMPNDEDNLYYSSSGSRIPNGPGIIDANPVYANPEFAQPSVGNYSMPSSSPAYTSIGFQPLTTDQGPIGSTGGKPPIGTTGGGIGILTGSGNSLQTTAHMTQEGPIDWAHWGTTSLTRKRNVTPQIGPWSIIGSGPAFYYTNDPRPMHFVDGTVPIEATVHDGIFINGANGFAFSVPASTTKHTLTVHVGGYLSGATLTAHLSDGSSADYVDATSLSSGQYDRNYTLSFQAASQGQTLTVKWVRNSGIGNVTLNGAALQ